MISGNEDDSYDNKHNNGNLIQMNGPDNELIFNGGARKKNIHSDKDGDKDGDKADTEPNSISKISSQDLEEIEYNEKLLGKYKKKNFLKNLNITQKLLSKVLMDKHLLPIVKRCYQL